MDFKYISWLLAILGLLTHIFGLLKCIALIICLAFFILGCLCAIYIQRGDLDHYLTGNTIKNPLENQTQKSLGLNLVCNEKPIVLISPNIKIQTDRELKKVKTKLSHYQYNEFLNSLNLKNNNSNTSQRHASKSSPSDTFDVKKRSFIDTGIELFFKKHGKNIKDGQNIKTLNHDVYLDTNNSSNNNTNLYHHPYNHHSSNLNNLNAHSLNDTTTTSTNANNTTAIAASNNTFLSESSFLNAGPGNHTNCSGSEEKKWKPFENIKIYTEKKKFTLKPSSLSSSNPNHNKFDSEQIQYGEDCTIQGNHSNNITNIGSDPSLKYFITLSNDAHLLDEHGSPKKKQRKMLSGNKQIDQLLHTIIDYILRDYIDSWFCSLSDNKEFSEFRVRNCIEECIMNICQRIKNTEWIPLMTTKLIDDLATHTHLYRHANQTINAQKNDLTSRINNSNSNDNRLSPQRKSKKTTQHQHKRNKSDTDLEWYLGASGSQKTIANSKFYTESKDDPTIINDPEAALLNAFFNQNEMFQNQCTNERELEDYLTHVVETILYFTLPEEDFACIPLRTFLSTLLANVVFKPLLEMLSDPDFINLQVAKLFAKDPPPVEYFLRALRQSNDLSELRACRQLIIQEMSSKFHESTGSGTIGNILAGNPELSSLKFAQKLIDMRISYLTNSRDFLDAHGVSGSLGHHEKLNTTKLPTLSLDELLFKELARSYFLDYLSVLNLQKYVIFYLTADEWKCLTNQALLDIQTNKLKSSKDEILRNLRDKAYNIFKEYLTPSSQNYLKVDHGLIEALSFKLNNPSLSPDSTWFDSIMKFIYEKLKNEDIFLPKFYQSSGYKKLLLELEVVGQIHEPYIDSLQNYSETSSDTNSGDINFDDEITTNNGTLMTVIKPEMQLPKPDLLDITAFKHSRSHSDCTGIIPSYSELNLTSRDFLNTDIEQNYSDSDFEDRIDHLTTTSSISGVGSHSQERAHSAPSRSSTTKSAGTLVTAAKAAALAVAVADLTTATSTSSTITATPTPTTITSSSTILDSKPSSNNDIPRICLESRPKLTAKIINTAILSEGQYAVYAIQVCIIEDNQEKSWHIYRRYSKFLELKKLLTKKYPAVSKIPFPAKKAFLNTQRAVLEHRMDLLNEFLRYICAWAEDNDDMMKMIRLFLEPDTDDRKIHGGTVIRTIEHIVNPLKTGMRTIRNMPDTLVGGFSRILLGKGPLKGPTFLEVNNLEPSSEYPALTSAIHLLDEIFDLQARSQWLRRGLINRVLGAPWVSHTANKKIIHAAKSLIEIDKIEQVLSAILNNIWPNGKQQKRSKIREDSTKLRTRIAAQMALFALVFDDLKRVVGSETTRSGLINFFGMWQHKELNMRLVLILMNDILTTIYRIESMTKHCRD